MSRVVEPALEVVLEQVGWCWLCSDERLFVPPDCADCAEQRGAAAFEGGCPERLCAECGAAVFVGVPVEVPQARSA